jgi:hypothetical protein
MHDVGVPGRSRPGTHSAVNRVMDTKKSKWRRFMRGAGASDSRCSHESLDAWQSSHATLPG